MPISLLDDAGVPAMTGPIPLYSIGYEKATLADLIATLRAAGVAMVLDVRDRLGFRMPAGREQSTRGRADGRRPKASEKRTRGTAASSWPSMGNWSRRGVGARSFSQEW